MLKQTNLYLLTSSTVLSRISTVKPLYTPGKTDVFCQFIELSTFFSSFPDSISALPARTRAGRCARQDLAGKSVRALEPLSALGARSLRGSRAAPRPRGERGAITAPTGPAAPQPALTSMAAPRPGCVRALPKMAPAVATAVTSPRCRPMLWLWQ